MWQAVNPDGSNLITKCKTEAEAKTAAEMLTGVIMREWKLASVLYDEKGTVVAIVKHLD